MNFYASPPECFGSGQSKLSSDPESSGRSWWLLLVGLVAVAVCLPFFQTIWSLEDEGVLIHGAERMLRGNKLYADFFEFLPPGGFVLTAGWFSITGMSVWSARSLAVLTIVGIACFMYLACRQASKNAPLSALLAVGWLIMSQGLWTQLSHHWFTTLFSMIATWAAVTNTGQERRWPLISGLAAGAAAMVVPTRGALVMLAGITALLNPGRRGAEFAVYVIASAVVPVGLLVFLAWNHALTAAIDDVIRFAATRYAPIQVVPFGSWANMQNYPFLYVFPLTVVLTLVICARDWRTCLHDRPLRPCIGFCIAGLLGCFPRPDISHIAFAVPLSCPLLAWCITRLVQGWRPAWRFGAAMWLIGLCGPTVLAYAWLADRALRTDTTTGPRGDVAFIQQPGASEMLARIVALPSGETVFFYPVMPLLPFLAAREHISKYDIFTPGFTLPSQYQDACQSVMRTASWVVIDRNWTDPNMLSRAFPAMRDPQPRETKAFEEDLDRSFDFVAREGTFELRHRVEGTGVSICSGIDG